MPGSKDDRLPGNLESRNDKFPYKISNQNCRKITSLERSGKLIVLFRSYFLIYETLSPNVFLNILTN